MKDKYDSMFGNMNHEYNFWSILKGVMLEHRPKNNDELWALWQQNKFAKHLDLEWAKLKIYKL